ncbi:MAG: cupin domain-containing protein [Gemmataceae bacterium]|nr:cupin domain-containing protein [Gemmataceae bacterium]
MQVVDLAQESVERERSGRLYREFLRVPALSAGLYELRAGADDPQKPHTEDEVYLVLRGRAVIRSGSEERAVGPGMVIFVSAGEEHRFHSIMEDLALLVVFAPAEDTSRP